MDFIYATDNIKLLGEAKNILVIVPNIIVLNRILNNFYIIHCLSLILGLKSDIFLLYQHLVNFSTQNTNY